jgi:hypothetical protein
MVNYNPFQMIYAPAASIRVQNFAGTAGKNKGDSNESPPVKPVERHHWT